MSSLISIQNLSKQFGSFDAVSGVSLSVKEGEVLGFLGPNGAGKTTTMRMITGYLFPSSGKVEVCGMNVLDNPNEARKQMGYLPEGGPLYNDMTPATFLKFIGEVRGLSGVTLDTRMDYVVKNLNLESVFNQTIDTLSKGYKRRVALAQAILHDPKVLVLDEPTDGLDPNQKHEVRALISAMAKKKAIIISTHILEEVEAICSRVVIISGGKVVATGTPDEIMKKSPSYNSVVVRLKTSPADKVLNDILQVKGVAKVNIENNNKIVATPENGKDMLLEVGDAVRKKRVVIEEIYVRKGNLDEAFRTLTKDTKAS